MSKQTRLDSLPSLVHRNLEKMNGIWLVRVDGEKQGSDIARELCYEVTDCETVLFLSGGNTPANLYSDLGRERRFKIGAAAMVDERYGKPMHANSNELMIERLGLTDYFKTEHIPFYRIISEEKL